MFAYISFFNNTNYPYISVSKDGEPIGEELPGKELSRYYVADAGSVSVTVFDNKNIPFLDIYISLYPSKTYILEITDTSAEFI